MKHEHFELASRQIEDSKQFGSNPKSAKAEKTLEVETFKSFSEKRTNKGKSLLIIALGL
jgi:hypothetical protein